MIYFNCDSNTIQQNTQFVYLQSHKGDAHTKGYYLNKHNFKKSLIFYSVRRLIKADFINKDNVYYTPIVKE